MAGTRARDRATLREPGTRTTRPAAGGDNLHCCGRTWRVPHRGVFGHSDDICTQSGRIGGHDGRAPEARAGNAASVTARHSQQIITISGTTHSAVR
ncbi:hypothetical protein FAIPA1_130106 [Frankia sp. AiPs1]